jgi:hypothetical protein
VEFKPESLLEEDKLFLDSWLLEWEVGVNDKPDFWERMFVLVFPVLSIVSTGRGLDSAKGGVTRFMSELILDMRGQTTVVELDESCFIPADLSSVSIELYVVLMDMMVRLHLQLEELPGSISNRVSRSKD